MKREMQVRGIVAALVVVWMSLAISASAAPVKFAWTGTITLVDLPPPGVWPLGGHERVIGRLQAERRDHRHA